MNSAALGDRKTFFKIFVRGFDFVKALVIARIKFHKERSVITQLYQFTEKSRKIEYAFAGNGKFTVGMPIAKVDVDQFSLHHPQIFLQRVIGLHRLFYVERHRSIVVLRKPLQKLGRIEKSPVHVFVGDFRMRPQRTHFFVQFPKPLTYPFVVDNVRSAFKSRQTVEGVIIGVQRLAGINDLTEKLFGVYRVRSLDENEPLLRGMNDIMHIPMSRHTAVDEVAVAQCKDIKVLAVGDQCGLSIAKSKDNKKFFFTGHSEYDRFTLRSEYFRDLDKGLPYVEEGLPQIYGREAFRANDFYDELGEWELRFVAAPHRIQDPVAWGDELDTAARLYRKYMALAREYYGTETQADAIREGNIFENLGKK